MKASLERTELYKKEEQELREELNELQKNFVEQKVTEQKQKKEVKSKSINSDIDEGEYNLLDNFFTICSLSLCCLS